MALAHQSAAQPTTNVVKTASARFPKMQLLYRLTKYTTQMRRGIKLQFGRSHQAVQTMDGDVYVIIDYVRKTF